MRYFAIINFGDRSHCTGQDLERMKNIFFKAGKEYKIVKSRSVPHSEKLVEQAIEEKYDVILIGGSDGTVNSILNFEVGKPVTVGMIPLGTVNALARSLKIPLNPIMAVEQAVNSYTPKSIDIGKLNGRAFVCFASIEFDVSVCHKIDPKVKIKLKKICFVLTDFASIGVIKNYQDLKCY